MQIIEAHHILADICFEQGKHTRAIEHLTRSVDILQTILRKHHELNGVLVEVGTRRAKTALCYLQQGDIKKAEELENDFLSMTRTLPWTQNTGIV